MSLSLLATVELQLIMQLCDRSSILALARCNRLARTAACGNFAWKFARTVTWRCGEGYLPARVFASLYSSSLLHFSNLALTWHMNPSFVTQVDVNKVAALPLVRLKLLGSVDDLSSRLTWLSTGLERCGTACLLTVLDLSFQVLRTAGTIAVAEMLRTCPRLECLWLPDCDITDAGMECLGAAIAAHPCLKQLSLSDNKIGPGGLVALRPAIQHRLEKIWLQRCITTNNDFSTLLDALLESNHMVLCDVERVVISLDRHRESIAELRANRPELQLLFDVVHSEHRRR
jgi:hypothetical protein